MTARQVLKEMLAKINRYVRVSYITGKQRAPGVLPADWWWQSNAAARVQSGLWGELLLAPGATP